MVDYHDLCLKKYILFQTLKCFICRKKNEKRFSCIAKIYTKTNYKYKNSFDDSKPSKFMIYFDANNLYGWAMSQYLP